MRVLGAKTGLGAPLGAVATSKSPTLDVPLAPLVARASKLGAAIRKSAGPEGVERLLGAQPRARLAAVLPTIEGAEARVAALLEGRSAVFGALVLRATLARLTRLVAGDVRALAEVERFAAKIAGLDDDTLKARATVLDLDSRVSTSDVDPAERAARRGVIHARGLGDTRTDNDGLYQRFAGSCGPTVLQMMIAEADPVIAFALHEGGLNAEGPGTLAAKFQAAILEHHGSVPLLSIDGQRWSRFRNALAKLDVPKSERAALLDYAAGRGKLGAGARRALVELRARYDFPSPDELALLRARPVHTRDIGMGVDALADAMEAHVSPVNGVFYEQTRYFARGQSYRYLDRVAEALAEGIDVPFGITEPDHWMLLTAVRGASPDRELLVSDPWSGRTAWVTEADLKSGVFAREQFDLCTSAQHAYVDCFFLPTLTPAPAAPSAGSRRRSRAG